MTHNMQDLSKVSSLCSVTVLLNDEFRGKAVLLIGLSGSAASTLAPSAHPPCVIVTRSWPAATLHLNLTQIVLPFEHPLEEQILLSLPLGLLQCVEQQSKSSALLDGFLSGKSSLPELSPGLQ